ncbi:hypothetical protein Moror_14665 [Moniliophthora roreri MCA 2997]|uniref:Uncharacterized protein n=1 Tax=Moniliophthora roreri (strain MCA 2997) TaxID=1381753 RepID=V2W1P6_MONRO|nr:hypothetical protein Moror_14665 [Moniliophthora roreri MCA 2997]
MAGAARTKLSKTPQAINQMEVTSLTLVIIQALYSIGEQILAAFEDLCDSLKEMGNASSSTLRLMFLHKLDKALSNNLTELELETFKYFSFSGPLEDVLAKYVMCKKSTIAPKSKSSHKHSPSLTTAAKSASALAPKKPKVDTSTSEATLQHPKPWPKPIHVKSSKASSDTVTVQVKSESDSNTRSQTQKPSAVSNKTASSSCHCIPDNNVSMASSSKGKGKGKIVISDVSDSEVIVEDMYYSTKIPAHGIQGCKLTEKPEFMDQLVEYFGHAQTLQNVLNSSASVAICSGMLAPLGTFLQCVTVLPKPVNKILTPACMNVKGVIRATKDLNLSLSSYASLLYQASFLSKDILVFNGLQEACSHLNDQISALSCSINSA